MNILVLTDNEYLLINFKKIIDKKKLHIKYNFDFAYSTKNKKFKNSFLNSTRIKSIDIKKQLNTILKTYDLIFSLHSKQFFPGELVNKKRCINVHPGVNPYNRGWFPQVFSIINGLPVGVTIHEMDKFLDHGPIIYQEIIEINSWDTSETVYNKILKKELELLDKNIVNLITNNYETFIPKEGNLNLKKDFDNLCKLNLNDVDTLENHINLLRALSHGKYKNAFFIDKDGNKIYLSIKLEKK